MPGLMSASLSSASSAESKASTPGSASISNMTVPGTAGSTGRPVERMSNRCCNATASSQFAPSSTRDNTRMALTGTSTRSPPNCGIAPASRASRLRGAGPDEA